MNKKITDEKTGINYTLNGDYYIPDLYLTEQKEEPNYGRFGRMRKEFIRKNHSYAFYCLFKDGMLNTYLNKTDRKRKKCLSG